MYLLTEEQKVLMQNAFQMIKDVMDSGEPSNDSTRVSAMAAEQIAVLEALPEASE